jgi:hypothetical protein
LRGKEMAPGRAGVVAGRARAGRTMVSIEIGAGVPKYIRPVRRVVVAGAPTRFVASSSFVWACRCGWPAANHGRTLQPPPQTPHYRGQRQTSQPSHMPMVRPLRHTLLHSGPATLFLTFNPYPVTRSCTRVMTTKPSLAAAEDFLSFVNASPTRMLAARSFTKHCN